MQGVVGVGTCRIFQSSKEIPRSLIKSVGGYAKVLERTLQLTCGLSGAYVSHMLCLDSAVLTSQVQLLIAVLLQKMRVCLTTGHELRIPLHCLTSMTQPG